MSVIEKWEAYQREIEWRRIAAIVLKKISTSLVEPARFAKGV